MSRQRAERLNPTAPGPDKTVQYVAFRKGGVAGKPNNVSSLIDCCRRVPPLSAKVADVGCAAFFPKHRMLGGMSSNGLVADARNAHGLTLVINRSGGPRRVAGD